MQFSRTGCRWLLRAKDRHCRGEGCVFVTASRRPQALLQGACVAQQRKTLVSSGNAWCRRLLSSRTMLPEHVEMPMPKLVPSMVQGVIARWLVAEGQYVDVADLVCEISVTGLSAELPEATYGHAQSADANVLHLPLHAVLFRGLV
jgi:hypothetical protein